MSNETLSPEDPAKTLALSPEDTAKTLPLSPPGRGARGEGFLNRIKPISNSDTSSTTTPDYERDLGKPTAILIALLLAFSTLWACLNLIAGPTALTVVMPLESTDVIPLSDMKTDQTINRQDARQCAKNANPNTLFASWRFLAPWRFHFYDHPFSSLFSTPPQPST